jgi:hypothetical protein
MINTKFFVKFVNILVILGFYYLAKNPRIIGVQIKCIMKTI